MLPSPKGKSPWETKHSPSPSLLSKAALAFFSPRPVLAIGTRWVWAASCSLGNGALLLSLELETYSKRALLWGEGGWGLKRPCVPWPKHPTLCQVGRDPARAHLRKGTKLASGSCICESETLLGKPSSAPMRLCSGTQRFLVSPLGLCLHYGQGGSGLPPAPWAMVLCCWSLELETNSKRALLWGEGGWGLKRPCMPWPQHPTL